MANWTVTFKASALQQEEAKLLENYEHESVQRQGAAEVDMTEEEFFSFADDLSSRGLSLPTDGSSSWLKH